MRTHRYHRRHDGRRLSLRPPRRSAPAHPISFAPAREAAASAILSRRWRPLWRRASAVNLDIRLYLPAKGEDRRPRSSTPLDAFFRDAVAALAAFTRRPGLKRLTLYLVLQDPRCDVEPRDNGRVAGLLTANPATAELEELLIGCQYDSRKYNLPPASMPCAATLRVLDLELCNFEPPSAPTLGFPRLTDLRLRNCFFMEGYLQAMVDAAPALTSLLLVNVAQNPLLEPPDSAEDDDDMPTYRRLPLRLRCLKCTVLELEAYARKQELETFGHIGIQLDMPRLRSFRYLGTPVKLSLVSPAPGLARVDVDATYKRDHSLYEPMPRMLTSFSTTRALKLNVSAMEDILDGEKEHGGVIFPTFPNLKLLHLDVFNERESSIMALAMARLLRSCPAMSELRLMIWWNYDYELKREIKDPATTPFAQSMDRFEKLASKASSHRSTSKISELPAALTGNCALFSCLQRSLQKVTLLFNTKEVDCFQVKLAKFLAENAMVLEEMHIVDGSQFWPEHLRHKLARWRA